MDRKETRRTKHPFELPRIQSAITNAFRAELNVAEGQPLDEDVLRDVAGVAQSVADDIAPLASQPEGADVERIQDLVEMGLMARGHYRVARRDIIYRSEHAKMHCAAKPRQSGSLRRRTWCSKTERA